jgi:hypothetical protein
MPIAPDAPPLLSTQELLSEEARQTIEKRTCGSVRSAAGPVIHNHTDRLGQPIRRPLCVGWDGAAYQKGGKNRHERSAGDGLAILLLPQKTQHLRKRRRN